MQDNQRQGELKKLQKEWYGKLKAEGFQDVEEVSNDCYVDLIKLGSMGFRVQKHPGQYYERAWRLFHAYKFKNPVHKYIWDLHCQGLTERKIAEEVIYKKSMVHAIISKHAGIIKA